MDVTGQDAAGQPGEMDELAEEAEREAEQAGQAVAVAALRVNVEKLQQTNDAKLEAMARNGVQIQAGVWAGIKVDVLAELFLGDLDQPDRLAFEQMYQLRCADTIAGWEKQVREHQLAARPQPEPMPGFRADRTGLLLPG